MKKTILWIVVVLALVIGVLVGRILPSNSQQSGS